MSYQNSGTGGTGSQEQYQQQFGHSPGIDTDLAKAREAADLAYREANKRRLRRFMIGVGAAAIVIAVVVVSMIWLWSTDFFLAVVGAENAVETVGNTIDSVDDSVNSVENELGSVLQGN